VSRAERLARVVAAQGLDLFVVGDLVRPGDSSPEAIADVRWLTGFAGTSGVCLVGPDERIFLTDFRYVERAEREVDPSFERRIAERQLLPSLAKLLHGRVGYDDARTSVRNLRRLEELSADGVELVAAGGLVEGLRRHKDELELRAIAEAAQLADEALGWLLEQGVGGRSERELALALEQRMRELGAEAPAFPAIVGAGPNSALPHHESSDREVRPGEVLLIDWGAKLDGYCSDGTRTFAVGQVGDEEREVHELVRTAQEAGLDAVRSGIAGRDADAAARKVIDAAGYGDRFGHGLGHGVGLEVHEPPRLAQHTDDELAEGDVVTVEPGIYLPGRFGVRIEDLVAIEPDGVRNMSSMPKELRVID
jgi:Xaa-Pro aminopeptidase